MKQLDLLPHLLSQPTFVAGNYLHAPLGRWKHWLVQLSLHPAIDNPTASVTNKKGPNKLTGMPDP
jgi:hypothetical protein